MVIKAQLVLESVKPSWCRRQLRSSCCRSYQGPVVEGGRQVLTTVEVSQVLAGDSQGQVWIEVPQCLANVRDNQVQLVQELLKAQMVWEQLRPTWCRRQSRTSCSKSQPRPFWNRSQLSPSWCLHFHVTYKIIHHGIFSPAQTWVLVTTTLSCLCLYLYNRSFIFYAFFFPFFMVTLSVRSHNFYLATNKLLVYPRKLR